MKKYTRFFDMSSGGYEKKPWTTIYIELPEDEAIQYFEKEFGRDPTNVTCLCCAQDYSISETNEILDDTPYPNTLIISIEEINK